MPGTPQSSFTRPRFDNVLSFGSLLQLGTLVFSLVFGAFTFYSTQARQSEKLVEIQVALDRLNNTLTADIRDLDKRMRVVETESIRHDDRLVRLEGMGTNEQR